MFSVFFALGQGKCIATYLPGATLPIHHVHDVTSLKSTSNDIATYPSATFRVYSSSSDAPLPDNTIVFVVAKVSAPTSKPIKLDALYLSAFHGDPNDDQYDMGLHFIDTAVRLISSAQEHIPDCSVFIYGVGHILATHTPQVLNDSSKAFMLSLMEYVSGAFKSSTVHCIYPAIRHWANVPLPRAQIRTQFLGMCNGFSESALLQIALEHVTLSLRPHSLAQQTTNTSADSSGSIATPIKHRKYVATGSTSTPTSTGSASTAPAADLAGPSAFPAIVLHPISSFTPPDVGPSSSAAVHDTRSKKLKCPASNASPSPAPDDDDVEEIPNETAVKAREAKYFQIWKYCTTQFARV
ncbi:hypothetical protein B0H13DRAFT_2305312 [Mycena leptocephala]|nr:hypothetical protein B0H13DRAFT_2305312 [Mycena leptocephala]